MKSNRRSKCSIWPCCTTGSPCSRGASFPRPLHFNFVMGLKGAMPARIEHLVHLVGCLPQRSTWSVSGVAAAQLPMAVHAILMGGHVRVGLEDNIYFRKGELATNQMLVERIVQIGRILGREVATPDEARQILNLDTVKGETA